AALNDRNYPKPCLLLYSRACSLSKNMKKNSRTASGKNTDTAKRKAKDTAAELSAAGTSKLKSQDINLIVKKAPTSRMPENIKPMKATLVDEAFDDPDWLYEVKWDGYRAVATVQQGEVSLVSRNNLSFEKYYPLIQLLKEWKSDMVIDGEIVVLNDKGLSDFGALQNWRSEADGHLVYYV